MKLHTKISIGLLLGAIVGVAANLLAQREVMFLADAVGLLAPLGTVFIRAITMIVIPLVVASLVVGIASLGDLRALGRIGGKTLAFYMSTTAIAVTIGIVLSNVIEPGSRIPEESKNALLAEYGGEAEGRIALADQTPGISDMLVSMVPSNPIASAAEGDMLPLIVFTLVFGAAASLLRDDRKQVFIRFFESVNDVSMTVIHWIMKTAPYAVFALIAAVTARFGLDILKSLLVYSLVVLAGLLLHAFGTYALVIRFLAKLKPLDFYRRIREVPLLAFSTSSSNATLPITIATAEEKLGVSSRVASFVLPLGATINMDGTALYQGVAVMFIAQVFGIDLHWTTQLTVVLTATLASVGAAGVPSAGIVTLALVLRQANVPETGIALILGVDRILDMLRTAVNVTGDLSASAFVARSEGELGEPTEEGLARIPAYNSRLFMFTALSEKLTEALRGLTRRGVLTEDAVREGLREVRRVLLEADVSYELARTFTNTVAERAIGQQALKGVNPGQQVVKIVHDELVGLLGRERAALRFASVPPTIVLLVGLQGSGKTTTAAKLAARLKKEQKAPFLVAADVYRPAAEEQLRQLAGRIDVGVWGQADGRTGGRVDVVARVRDGIAAAGKARARTVIVDTAGRLQIDQAMMDELVALREAVTPHEILLVADAMTGQDAVRIAQGFHEALGVTGVILTKLDGDARGGAALSMHGVTGAPIKYVGTGEGLEALEPMDPARLAGRILQQGDVVGLVERASEALDQEAAAKVARKALSQKGMDLEDFLATMRQMQKLGPLEGLLGMLPGMNAKALKQVKADPNRLRYTEAIILSMTPAERQKPALLNGSRRARIARGSGRPVQEVNQLIKQFDQMRKMMKGMKGPMGLMGLGRRGRP